MLAYVLAEFRDATETPFPHKNCRSFTRPTSKRHRVRSDRASTSNDMVLISSKHAVVYWSSQQWVAYPRHHIPCKQHRYITASAFLLSFLLYARLSSSCSECSPGSGKHRARIFQVHAAAANVAANGQRNEILCGDPSTSQQRLSSASSRD